ncbi:hypothetical protein Y697_08220 [Mesotoga sp. BH458_6_3_2_1]|nr:hypothetical protein Y697_08220 [Mesotoga sp. BH458_6_3_2_1]
MSHTIIPPEFSRRLSFKDTINLLFFAKKKPVTVFPNFSREVSNAASLTLLHTRKANISRIFKTIKSHDALRSEEF